MNRHLRAWWLALVATTFVLVAATAQVQAQTQALTPIDMGVDIERVDITMQGRALEARGDAVQVDTAVAADGTTGRMSVKAATPGTSPNWFVFALKNPTDKALERWLVADRYSHAGSGVIWPVLDERRIEAVTPSLGVVPERLPFDNADAFRMTVEPGQTVTFVVELVGDRLVRMQLWRGADYEKRSRNRQLFHGILLGIVGLMAIFLTTIFAANHKAIFPSAALFTWCVLIYLCVDFGLWHKLFNVRPEENAQYRAAGEAAMAASLLIFAHTFLRLGRWHAFIRMLIGLAMLATLALVGLAFLDPRLSATFARLGLVGVLAGSGLVTAYLALRGQDRALAIIPSWVLFAVWMFGAAMVLTGRLQSDTIVNAIMTGLVLLVLLIGFTVTQFAFRNVEPMIGASPDDQQLRALAVESTGAAIFEWNAKREEVRLGPLVMASLGHKAEEIREPLATFTERMHPADRDRLVQVLNGLKDQGKGIVQIEFKLRHVDTSYRVFELEGSGVATNERRMARCVGLVREVTDAKRMQERLLHDAVHDSLTNIPNRALLLDRLGVAIARARTEALIRPAVFFIDLDEFNSVNAAHGVVVGDSLLITVARRLGLLVSPADTLARVGGDQFAMVFTAARDARELHHLAEEIRAAIKGMITIANREIVLTCSIGVAEFDVRSAMTARELLSDAEVAMYRARRGGADRIEMFDAAMRSDKDDRLTIESDLRAAIDKNQLSVQFRPIMYLRTEELSGFEVQVRWEHPRYGVLDPTEFVPIADGSDLLVKLGGYILQSAVSEALRWNEEFQRSGNPIYVSVNISTRQLLHPELIAQIRHLLAQSKLPRDALRLEITEMLVMENPEQATAVLQDLAQTGVRLSLDDFGAGYSSLSYLTAFPFDTVKADRALVHAATQGPAGAAVMRSIVALCHELGKTVVAEGTDSEEDAGLLRSLGCDYAQGTFYGDARGPRETMGIVKDMRRADKRRKGGGLFQLKARRIDEEAAVRGAADASMASAPAQAVAPAANSRNARRSLRQRPVQADAVRSAAASDRASAVVHSSESSRGDEGYSTRQTRDAGVPGQSNQVYAGAEPVTQRPPPQPTPHAAPPQAPPPVQQGTLPELSSAAPPRAPMVPPPAVEPLPIDRSLSRLRAEIARTSVVSARPANAAQPPPLPSGQTVAAQQQGAIDERATSPPAAANGIVRPAVARSPAAAPDLSSLPPAIAASLAKLAGVKPAERKTERIDEGLPSTGTDGGGGG